MPSNGIHAAINRHSFYDMMNCTMFMLNYISNFKMVYQVRFFLVTFLVFVPEYRDSLTLYLLVLYTDNMSVA